jgi:hypothetical protein
MVQTAAIMATMILFGMAVFQLLLVIGKPLGMYAWGGQHKVLPNHLRISSVFSMMLYAVFSMIILDRAGLISGPSARFAEIGTWALAGYFGLGIIMNGLSRSRHERAVMTPLSTLLALLCVVVAVGA